MKRQALDLGDVELFLAIIDQRSLSTAARLLGLPKSTVSRQLARLEQALGTRLVARSTQAMEPTQAGTAFALHARRMMAELDEADRALQDLSGSPQGLLRVCAPAASGQLLVAPLIPAFLEQHPAMRVQLELEGDRSRRGAGEPDLEIKIGPLEDSARPARKLGEAGLALFASPGYLARRGAPATPADLAAHDLCDIASPDHRHAWSLTAGDQRAVLEVRPRFLAYDALALRAALVHGAGISWLPTFVAEPERSAGLLVPVLPDWRRPPREIFALLPEDRHATAPKVRAFVDHLVRHFRVEPSRNPARAVPAAPASQEAARER